MEIYGNHIYIMIKMMIGMNGNNEYGWIWYDKTDSIWYDIVIVRMLWPSIIDNSIPQSIDTDSNDMEEWSLMIHLIIKISGYFGIPKSYRINNNT